MKKFLVILGFLLVAVLALTACGGNDGMPLVISVDEGHQKYEDGVFLLDVRTQAEWDEAHVPNAVLIPLDELESRLSEVPSDQEVVVMCRSGNRSLTATELLRENGFKQTQSLSGGIGVWAANGFPVIFGK